MACRAVGPWEKRLLRGINTGNAGGSLGTGRETEIAPQLSAHLAQQLILGGISQINDTNRASIAPAPCSAHGQDRQPSIACPGDDEAFIGHLIDGIDDKIKVWREEMLGCAGGKKLRMNGQFAPRINQPHPFGQHVDFCTADLPIERGKLPIDIGHADVIQINHRNGADPGTHKSFDCPGANAAHSDNADMRPAELFEAGKSVKARDSAKARQIIVYHLGEVSST